MKGQGQKNVDNVTRTKESDHCLIECRPMNFIPMARISRCVRIRTAAPVTTVMPRSIKKLGGPRNEESFEEISAWVTCMGQKEKSLAKAAAIATVSIEVWTYTTWYGTHNVTFIGSQIPASRALRAYVQGGVKLPVTVP